MGKEIYIVRLTGNGYKNGNVRIDKELEFDNMNESGDFYGENKYDEISRVIKYHYPNVEFDPKQIAVHTSFKTVKNNKLSNKNSMAAAAIGGFIAGKATSKTTPKNQVKKPTIKEHNTKDKKLPRKEGSDKFGKVALIITGLILIMCILWLME